MAFKLGSEKRDLKNPKNVKMHNSAFNMNNIELVEESLEENTVAEARNDGKIAINADRVHRPEDLKKTIKHEMKHMVDMKTGKLSYTDNDITWMGETYPRQKGKILFNNEWIPEGSKDFPWEKMPWE